MRTEFNLQILVFVIQEKSLNNFVFPESKEGLSWKSTWRCWVIEERGRDWHSDLRRTWLQGDLKIKQTVRLNKKLFGQYLMKLEVI